MSIYHLMNGGVDQATFYILPMLGEKHPDQYPRFRDCKVFEIEETGELQIHVLTRTGGGNRNQGYGEEELTKHPNYITDYDHANDNTYAIYVFSIPDEWKNDFELMNTGRYKEISQAYKERMYKTYPKIEDKLKLIFE